MYEVCKYVTHVLTYVMPVFVCHLANKCRL